MYLLVAAVRVPQKKGGSKTEILVKGNHHLCQLLANRVDGRWVVKPELHGAAITALCGPDAEE